MSIHLELVCSQYNEKTSKVVKNDQFYKIRTSVFPSCLSSKKCKVDQISLIIRIRNESLLRTCQQLIGHLFKALTPAFLMHIVSQA